MAVSNDSTLHLIDRLLPPVPFPVDPLLTTVPCDFVEWDGRWKLSHHFFGTESTEFARVYKVGSYTFCISQSGLYYPMYGDYPKQSDDMMGCKYCDRFLPSE